MNNKAIKRLIIFTDCGDTLVDESTQVFSDLTVVGAQMIEGALPVLHELHEQGYRIALVADGRVDSFDNIMEQHGLRQFFEATAVSEEVGCEKPDPLMFRTAMERMGLTDADAGRIVMVGNNLKRDVLGANRMGIRSVLLTFSPRYCMTPQTPEEYPRHTIAMPCELTALVAGLEQELENEENESIRA